jgi:hypothetical protein
MRIFGGLVRRVTSCTIEDQETIRPGPAGGWHAAKLRLSHVSFPLGFIALVRAAAPDLLIVCDRGPPCLRSLALHLETTGRPNADCSSSTTSVDRRGRPSMPRAELGIHGLNR